MPNRERRQPANAVLREKIDRMQSAQQRLKTLMDQVTLQTLHRARGRHADDLSDPQQQLRTFNQLVQLQAGALTEVKREMWDVAQAPVRTSEALIDADELAALMKISQRN